MFFLLRELQPLTDSWVFYTLYCAIPWVLDKTNKKSLCKGVQAAALAAVYADACINKQSLGKDAEAVYDDACISKQSLGKDADAV